MTVKAMNVTALSWSQLCALLLDTDNVVTLQRWLEQETLAGKMYRALRVHGRMNAVRRDKEIRAIKQSCGAVNEELK